jgi:hypothetical protein
MQDVSSIPSTIHAAVVHSHQTQQQSRDEGHVQARDLHPGDVLQQHDWPLHVREVTLSLAAVTVAVTEFEFPLHYAADAEVQLTV